MGVPERRNAPNQVFMREVFPGGRQLGGPNCLLPGVSRRSRNPAYSHNHDAGVAGPEPSPLSDRSRPDSTATVLDTHSSRLGAYAQECGRGQPPGVGCPDGSARRGSRGDASKLADAHAHRLRADALASGPAGR